MRFNGAHGIGNRFIVSLTNDVNNEGGEIKNNKLKDIGINGNPDLPIGDTPTFTTKSTLKAVHSMTPEDAKAKFADAQMQYDFRGEGYGKVRDAQGRIAHRVYADKAGNVSMFVDYSYNSDGTLNNSKSYSLRNGQYVLMNVVEYNEKEGYAVEQGYMNGNKPTPGFLINAYDANKPEDSQLSFDPNHKFPAGLREKLAATHGENAPIPQ